MPKIFHVILDEKFIDNAIQIFDSIVNIKNEYLLVSKSRNVSMIKNINRIKIFRSNFTRLRYIYNQAPEVIILHSLFFGATLVPFVSRKSTIVWISWGQDLYKDIDEKFTSSYPFCQSLFMEETRKWINSQKTNSFNFLKTSLKAFVKKSFRSYAIKKINYISTCLPYEYPLIHEKFPQLRRFEFDYIDKTPNLPPACNDFNILIGNSASINNNHLDIFKTMKERNIKANKIIAPLSYGGGNTYRDAVIKAGDALFGSSFYPLIQFIDIDKYTELIRGCSFALFGFLRQQATKNIQLLLWQGSKIFFYKETEIFKYFKSAGYIVFSIEDDLTASNLKSLLSAEEIARNRELVSNLFYYNENIRNVEKSIKMILKKEK